MIATEAQTRLAIEAGEKILVILEEAGRQITPANCPKDLVDVALGRLLLAAVFRALQDRPPLPDRINRVGLVSGIARCLGETAAQQTPENQAAIMDTIATGLEIGFENVTRDFEPVGNA